MRIPFYSAVAAALAFFAAATSELFAADPSAYRFEDFAVVLKNNIFDAERRDRPPSRPAPPKPSPPAPDYFALTGTSRQFPDKKDFAFFTGSDREFRKVLETGQTIAGYVIETIGTNAITLSAADRTLDLVIGMEMFREPGGEWEPRNRQRRGSGSSRTASGRSDETSKTDQAAAPDDAERKHRLQEMMARRKQQMDQ